MLQLGIVNIFITIVAVVLAQTSGQVSGFKIRSKRDFYTPEDMVVPVYCGEVKWNESVILELYAEDRHRDNGLVFHSAMDEEKFGECSLPVSLPSYLFSNQSLIFLSEQLNSW